MRAAWKGSLSVVVIACRGLGCGGGGAASSASASATAKSATPSNASARPSGSAAGSATSASTASASDFKLVLDGAGVKLFPLGAAAIVDAGAFYAVVDDGPLVQDPALTKTAYTDEGRPVVLDALKFGEFWGRWPDQVIALGDTRPGVFGRVNATWTDQSPLRDGEHLLAVTAWDKGRALAVMRMVEPDIRMQLVNSSGGVVVPGSGAGPKDQPDCNTPFDPDAPLLVSGLPTGELFAVARSCKSEKATGAFWKPKEASPTVVPIDGVPDGATPVAVVAASPSEAYGLFTKDGTAFLATWDGSAWKSSAAPSGAPTAGSRSVGAAPDGSAWLVGESGVFVHPKGGAFGKLEVPGKSTGFWAKDEKTAWVVIDGKKLYRRGGAATATVELPPMSDVATALDRDKRWLATSACKSIYVHLAAIGPSGGDAPKSFAGLTSAVKGKADLERLPFIVEEVGPTQVAGAVVPSMEVAKALSDAYIAANAKAKPMFFCHEPIVKGKLALE